METVSAPIYPATPQTHQASHLRTSTSRASPAMPMSSAATRSMQEAVADSEPAAPPPSSAPDSQESAASAQHSHHSANPQLRQTSSNVSHSTSYTNLTSPPSSAPEQYVASHPDLTRVRTPDTTSLPALPNGHAHAHAQASSLRLDSATATTNGTKRTASGHVKNAPSLPNTPTTTTSFSRARTDSMSSTHSRAGDLAMTLKSRLGFAMAKVQHGLEHRNVHEAERLAVYKDKARENNRHSMSHLTEYGTTRRPSLTNGGGYEGTTNGQTSWHGSAAYPPPSKRHSGSYYTSFHPPSSSQPAEPTLPRLQPAPDIQPRSHHHHNSHSHSHSHSLPSSQTDTTMTSPPLTPVNGSHPTTRRPPSIRTNMATSEKERDALQALFQLGSPQGSQVPPRASSSQASPLRSDFATPRRVTFARSESDSSASFAGEMERP